MPITLTPNSSGSTWYYAAQQDVQDLIGTDNETVSFDEDNDGNLNADQVLRAGEWSDAYINTALANASLTVPNDLSDANVTAMLKSASAHLAVWYGFHQRGVKATSNSTSNGIADLMTGYKTIADELIGKVIGFLTLADTDDDAIPAGSFGFVPIVRDNLPWSGDENSSN